MVKNGNAFAVYSPKDPANISNGSLFRIPTIFYGFHYHPLPYITITAFQFSNNLSLIYSLPFSLSNRFYRKRDIPKVRWCQLDVILWLKLWEYKNCLNLALATACDLQKSWIASISVADSGLWSRQSWLSLSVTSDKSFLKYPLIQRKR